MHASHSAHAPCLPHKTCTPVKFTFGTLPMRPFTGGHTWFNQNVQQMAGHEQPQNEPITVHFTFQFGDTGEYPHGKRQRAREAALWAVDPPEYFTEGVFVAVVGPTTTPEYKELVYKRFPEWYATLPSEPHTLARGDHPALMAPLVSPLPFARACGAGRRSGTCSWTPRSGRRCATS